jgi:pimeloyl-ACP methyl ester carboxylesterase
MILLSHVLLSSLHAPPHAPLHVSRVRPARMAVYETITIANAGPAARESYSVKIQRTSALYDGKESCPAIVCIPPIGVGITRTFYEPLHREWAALGAPCELHTPDLLGNGDSHPKPRRFYTPQVWADQLLEYINSTVKRPVVLLSQGGLLPVALEIWRTGGTDAVAGVCFASPPPLRFFAPDAETEVGVRKRFTSKAKRPSRRGQRAFWLLAQTPIGNLFFRRLRGANGKRIQSFSERNLFADPAGVDAEWLDNCREGSRDARSRFATFAYLAGTVPGGSWRDDRASLLESLTVPCQVLRGDSVEGAASRLDAFVERVPRPSCCALVADGRAVLPYENAQETATRLAAFLAANFDPAIDELVGARPKVDS